MSTGADGMRIKKVEGLTIGWNGDEGSASGYYTETMTLNAPTERYWYDGQMAHEEDRTFKVGSTTYKNVTKYGLGARGIDYMSHFDDQTDTTTVGFPIYDGHGNMIATLSRAGSSPYYSTGNLRLYDVWGSVRSGSSSGLPNQRYCANLGHRQDDESGLIYMRARYYEPSTGRFITEDPAMDGANWYSYCGNDPITYVDESGNYRLRKDFWGNIGQLAGAVGITLILTAWAFATLQDMKAASNCIQAASALMAVGLAMGTEGANQDVRMAAALFRLFCSSPIVIGLSYAISSGWSQSQRSETAGKIVGTVCAVYSILVLAYLVVAIEYQ